MYTAGREQERQAEQKGAFPSVAVGVQIGLHFFGNILKLWLPQPEAYGAALLLVLLLLFPWRPDAQRRWPFRRWALWSLGWASLVAFLLHGVTLLLSTSGIGATKP